MKITKKEIVQLDQAINVLTTRGVTEEAKLKILGLKDEITGHIENYRKEFKQIMSDFGVELIEEGYDWSEKEDKEAITQKINELAATEVEVTGLQQYELKDVLSLTAGLTIGDITYFKKYLLK